MPSSYSASLRYELQANGENLNTWGIRLNNALVRIDKSVAGRVAIVLAGVTYTLSTANGADDEARSASLDLSGVGGCNLVIPPVSKLYFVRNGASGPVTVTTGAGGVVILAPNDAAWVWSDGSAVYTTMIGGVTVKSYVDTLRAYVDATAWGTMTGVLPGQPGNGGKFLQTDGATPTWVQPQTSDLSDIAAYTAARQAETAAALATSIGLMLAL